MARKTSGPRNQAGPGDIFQAFNHHEKSPAASLRPGKSRMTNFEVQQTGYRNQGADEAAGGAWSKARQAISRLVAFTEPKPEAKLQPGWAG